VLLTLNTLQVSCDTISSACPIVVGFWSCATQNVAIERAFSALGERTSVSGDNMQRKNAKSRRGRKVPDVDFSGGVRGKYAARYAAGANLVLLSPDVAEIFPDSAAVNEALRTLVRLSGKTVRVRAPKKADGG